MTQLVRGFIIQDVPVPNKHISVLAGAPCVVGHAVSGDKTAISLMIGDLKFTTVVDNRVIVIDSSHVDLSEFHGAQHDK